MVMEPERKLWTQTRGRAARRCRMLEHLRFVEGWRRAEKSEALWFGTLWHQAMEVWWSPDVPSEEKLPKALARVAGLASDPYEQVRLNVMLEAYHHRWIKDLDQWRVISIEEKFVAPVINPDTEHASRTWDLAGKLDVLAQHIESEKIYIFEHKTTGETIDTPDTKFWVKLAMDPQVNQYYLGAMHNGHDVYGVIYDVAAKTRFRMKRIHSGAKRKVEWTESDAEIAERNAERKPLIQQKGESFDDWMGRNAARKSLKRKSTEGESDEEWNARCPRDETPQEFEERFRGEYFADIPKYVQRRDVARSDSQLADVLKDIWIDTKVSHQCERIGFHSRNPDACEQWGRMCAFFDHCAHDEGLENNPKFVKGELHPELKE